MIDDEKGYELTLLESQMVEYIYECQHNHYYCPSQYEIGCVVDRCKSIVNRHLHRLQDVGILKLMGVRQIEILSAPEENSIQQD